MRRFFSTLACQEMRLSATLLCAALAANGCARTPRSAGPSLLLVTLDTVRADHLGCYGGAGAETPNLDRLAREGVRFAAASTVAPLTLPAHSTILSGLLPVRHGVHENGAGAFPADLPTIASRLRGAGYETAAFVGAFVLDHRFGLARGFTLYDDEIRRQPGAGSLDAERPGSIVVDRALAWIARPRTSPFFAWVHLYDAHAPYTPSEPFKSRHAGDPYSGEIAGIDAQVGRLLAALAARGELDRTLIAVVGDHGEALGDHGELTHGLLLYEPTLRVPLLLRAPAALKGGTIVQRPVSTADLAPTLMGLLGLAGDLPEQPAAGRDLSPALRTGAEPAGGEVYAETEYPTLFGWGALHSLRQADRKLIAGPRPELYDLGRDPGETQDLLVSAPSPGSERPATALETSLAKLRRQGQKAVPENTALPDAETRARLQSLGYANGASVPRPAGAQPNPVAMAPLFRRYEEARAAEEAGRPAEAASILEAMVGQDPANPVFQGALGLAWRGAGHPERALAPYRKAVELVPTDPLAWYNLAVTLREAGRADESLAALRETLRIAPDLAEARNALGVALSQQGDIAGAVSAFSRAVELDPGDAAAFNNLGNALRDQSHIEEAAAAYRRAIELAPDYSDALNGLGVLEVGRSRAAAGLPLLERALALAPGSHEIRLNRAVALEMLGQIEGAAEAYRDFLRASAADPQFTAQRTAARARLARLDGRGRSAAGERR